MHIGLHKKVLSDIHGTWIFSREFWISRKSVHWEPRCTKWMDRHTHTLHTVHTSINCVTKTVGSGTSHKYTTTHNSYNIKYSKHFTKQ
jgi:hypothetical protein